ncbi:hypothetical protein FBF25_03870 [Candidatus Saccharibacteria bacterium oral taxon 488]|nr:hypothetical protein FBF25_03870 [Candidatus Saccharibacteria bacterium oral taxon 488]QLF52171.1 hypothetical protein HW277_03920 [Candidatus Saccharibacteria bacterium oral taxon 488]
MVYIVFVLIGIAYQFFQCGSVCIFAALGFVIERFDDVNIIIGRKIAYRLLLGFRTFAVYLTLA